jgi:HK97 gp10 family phage protein
MIDLSSWAASVKAAAVASLEASGAKVAGRAKEKAPVRKIFAGGRRKIRFRTAAEVMADAPLRERLGLGPELAAPEGFGGSPRRNRRYAQTVTVGNLRNMRAPAAWRRIGRPGHLRMAAAEEMLSRTGRSEVKSGRSAYEGKIGGRLKGEITSTEARIDGSRIVVEVISPTAYAKYQEFGTRHHPAHPFLRPALEESRQEIVSGLRSAVGSAARRPSSGGRKTKKVKVTLKAGR